MADTEITGLVEETAPVSADLVVIVDDVAGTPATEKTTIANLTKGLSPNALTAKVTPVAADEVILGDTEAANVAKKATLTALDTTLRGITGVEAAADVTDATNVDAAGAVMEADYNANTILAATADNTPAALTVAEQTIVGRITAGAIDALTAAEVRTLLNVEDGATADQSAAEIMTAIQTVDGTGSGLDADLLDGNEAAAFATAAQGTLADGAVQESDYNAQTVLAATADNTPAALTVGEQTLVGRITGGNIAALTATQARTIVTSAVDVNAETASFTFALADAGLLTTISNAGATTATIPPNSSVAFPVGTMLYLVQIGAGAATWTQGAGVTINYDTTGKTLVTKQYGYSFARKTATDTWEVGGDLVPVNPLEAIIIAASDEGTALTTGTGKVTFHMPYAFTLTDIKATVGTAPTDASLIADVNDGGTSIMTTNKLTIETGEFSTETATTGPTLTDTALAENAVISVDIDQIGSTIAGAGLKVYLIGRRT